MLAPVLLSSFFSFDILALNMGIDDVDAQGRHITCRLFPSFPCNRLIFQWMQPLSSIYLLQIHHIYGDHASSNSWGCKPRQATWYIFNFLTGSYCTYLPVFSNSNPYPLPLEMIFCNRFQPQSLYLMILWKSPSLPSQFPVRCWQNLPYLIYSWRDHIIGSVTCPCLVWWDAVFDLWSTQTAEITSCYGHYRQIDVKTVPTRLGTGSPQYI